MGRHKMFYPINSESGFDIAVLTQLRTFKLSKHKYSDEYIQRCSRGLFLISSKDVLNKPLSSKDVPNKPRLNNSAGRGNKLKKTNNRKREIFVDHYEYNGKMYPVNAKKSGLYEEILKSMIEQFDIAFQNWKRVFVYRFDLHMDFFSKKNDCVTNFKKRLVQKLKRDYGFKEVGYCWVREIESAESPHYHWVLFLDGRLIRHPSKLSLIIKNAWEYKIGAFHMPVIRNPFYYVEGVEDAQEAIYRISYLAKVRGKGHRSPQTNDFSCSRMKLK